MAEQAAAVVDRAAARAALDAVAGGLLASMAAGDPSTLPLAEDHVATENWVSGAVPMLAPWRTVTAVEQVAHLVIDEVAGEVLVCARLAEAGCPMLLWARLQVVAGLITELELFTSRSRADSGFVYLVDEVGTLPAGWTSDGARASRAELLALGHAVFDPAVEPPAVDPDCLLMEGGGVVLEDPTYLALLTTGAVPTGPAAEREAIHAGFPPFRPADPDARVVAVDEEQGVVVVIGTVRGAVTPYVTPTDTESCFVPAEMLDMHHRTLLPELTRGRQLIAEQPVWAASCHVLRLHSGAVQGMHMLNRMLPAGARSPWH